MTQYAALFYTLQGREMDGHFDPPSPQTMYVKGVLVGEWNETADALLNRAQQYRNAVSPLSQSLNRASIVLVEVITEQRPGQKIAEGVERICP